MEESKWRISARVVALVQMVLSILACVAILLLTILAGFLTIVLLEGIKNQIINERPYGHLQKVCGSIWFSIASATLMTGFQLWASFKLLSATELGSDFSEALKKVRIWLYVTIIVLAVKVGGFVAVDIWVFGIVDVKVFLLVMAAEIFCIVWPFIFLFVVYKYMMELEMNLVSGGVGDGNNYPVSVTVQ